MSTKEMKGAFGPASQALTNADPEDGGEDPVFSGAYPRSLAIIDFILTDLFGTTYAIPHTDRHAQPNDCVDYVTLQEQHDTHRLNKILISDPFILPQNETLFSFDYENEDNWGPLKITLLMTDFEEGEIDLVDSHPALQAAFREFMEDMALAATETHGVKVDEKAGTIEVRDPLALSRAIRALVAWRNMVDDDDAELSEDGQSYSFENRPVYLPDQTYLTPEDKDENYPAKLSEGSDFLLDDDMKDMALTNLPSRPYNNEEDLLLAAWKTKDRAVLRDPMFFLEEMDAIILTETRRQKTCSENPLYNWH